MNVLPMNLKYRWKFDMYCALLLSFQLGYECIVFHSKINDLFTLLLFERFFVTFSAFKGCNVKLQQCGTKEPFNSRYSKSTDQLPQFGEKPNHTR